MPMQLGQRQVEDAERVGLADARWIASAAGGTSQRLKPGGAMVRSLEKNDIRPLLWSLVRALRRPLHQGSSFAFSIYCPAWARGLVAYNNN